MNPQMELAVRLAAKELAKVASDYCGADYDSTQRNVRAMIMASLGGLSAVRESDWTEVGVADPWLSRTADNNIVDSDVLNDCINEWFRSLEANPKDKLRVIRDIAGHKDNEYINGIFQKYRDKPIEKLREVPELFKLYQDKAPKNPEVPQKPEEKVAPTPTMAPPMSPTQKLMPMSPPAGGSMSAPMSPDQSAATAPV